MIYIISSCTNSKKKSPLENLILQNYSFNSIDKSITRWKNSLNLSTLDLTTAQELYKGHSWQETLKGKEILEQKEEIKLLISSAGYGLIDSLKKINSYQATFSKGNENSIHNFKSDVVSTPTTVWWNKVNNYDTSSLDKNASIFITVSYEYLIAMENTINELIENFGEKVFIIVLSKGELPETYNKNLLHFDTRFNSFEKGTISSIIPRFSKWLFQEIVDNNLELNNQILQNHIDNFLSNFSTYTTPDRIQLTDEKILGLIKNQIEIKNITSKTKGLKDLRSEGYACSQERYGKLFTKVKGK